MSLLLMLLTSEGKLTSAEPLKLEFERYTSMPLRTGIKKIVY